MAAYRVTLSNEQVELIADADAYQQEGPMTTFFSTSAARRVVDSWSVRVASFRTAEILSVRRVGPMEEPGLDQGAGNRYSEACS